MQRIEYQGLVLRTFKDSDAAGFTAAVRESVESVGRWMPWCHAAYTERDALRWFETARAAWVAGSACELGIFSADTDHLLGGAGLNSINRQHLFCNLGYWVRQSAQRRGIASRTVRALVPYAFHQLGMRRVEIVVAEGNTASGGVARESGAQWECAARHRLQVQGVPVAASVFSLAPESRPGCEKSSCTSPT